MKINKNTCTSTTATCPQHWNKYTLINIPWPWPWPWYSHVSVRMRAWAGWCIYYSFWVWVTVQKKNLLQIYFCKSVADLIRSVSDPLQICCRSMHVCCRSVADPLQVCCRSIAGLLHIDCRSVADRLQVCCRSIAGLLQIDCRSVADLLQILWFRISIMCTWLVVAHIHESIY
jgi:hypothetical protein